MGQGYTHNQSRFKGCQALRKASCCSMCMFRTDRYLEESLSKLCVCAYSPREDEKCYGKCSASDVPEVWAVQGAVWGEPGESEAVGSFVFVFLCSRFKPN